MAEKEQVAGKDNTPYRQATDYILEAISFPGGIPIRDNAKEIIGAIGVSGDTVENDHAVAEAGIKGIS